MLAMTMQCFAITFPRTENSILLMTSDDLTDIGLISASPRDEYATACMDLLLDTLAMAMSGGIGSELPVVHIVNEGGARKKYSAQPPAIPPAPATSPGFAASTMARHLQLRVRRAYCTRDGI